jgi:hypothetical protein
MQFLTRLQEGFGCSLRGLAKMLGVTPQRLLTYRDRGEQYKEFMRMVCSARRLSGQSWGQFGKALDDEFKD